MDFYMHHGRLNPDGGGSDEEGKEIDDWGFEGPRLKDCIGFHCTYGADGHFNVFFKDANAAETAQRLTGWSKWDDNALTAEYFRDGSLLRIYNRLLGRVEFFGDWGIK